MLVSKQFSLGRSKMIGFLETLEAASVKAESLYLPPGLSPAEVENLLEKTIDKHDMPPNLTEFTTHSKTGAVLFWGLPRRCLILPPFPITKKYFTHGYDIEPLSSLLRHDFRVALILIRLGAYAVGICQGEKLIVSKVGTGLVHARHKKGGSSQRRFERHREKQIEYFLNRVCGHTRERLEPYARTMDYVVYGGARNTILSLQKRCLFLRQFDNRVLRLLLNIPQPRQTVLEAAIGDVWASSVTEWYDSGF